MEVSGLGLLVAVLQWGGITMPEWALLPLVGLSILLIVVGLTIGAPALWSHIRRIRISLCPEPLDRQEGASFGESEQTLATNRIVPDKTLADFFEAYHIVRADSVLLILKLKPFISSLDTVRCIVREPDGNAVCAERLVGFSEQTDVQYPHDFVKSTSPVKKGRYRFEWRIIPSLERQSELVALGDFAIA